MRSITLSIFLALSACASPPRETTNVSPDGWGPGVFRGLVVGRATAGDVRRVMGAPRDSGTADPELAGPRPATWYDYGHDDSLLPARATLFFQGDTLALVELVPDDPARANVLRRLGPGSVAAFYRECPGWDDSEAPPVYHDPGARPGEGAHEGLEYPARGISLSANESEVLAVVIGPGALRSRESCPAPPSPSRPPSPVRSSPADDRLR